MPACAIHKWKYDGKTLLQIRINKKPPQRKGAHTVYFDKYKDLKAVVITKLFVSFHIQLRQCLHTQHMPCK